MTTVCAVARDGRVVMGADSASICYSRPTLGQVKLMVLPIEDASANPDNPAVLIGMAGASAMKDLVRSELRVPPAPAPDDDPQPWAARIAQQITALMRDHSLLNSDGGLDGNALLGWSGHVWTISTSGAVLAAEGIAAIGAGEEAAMGALYAIDTWPRLMGEGESVDNAVRSAVVIANHLNIYSAGPVLVMSIP
ncbi:MAG: hypothetical protein ACR2N4_09210 [Jatrophihabitans sp.]